MVQFSHNLKIPFPDVISWQDDMQLVKASQQGDQDAFALLVQRHQRRVFNLVLRVLHNYEDASNVTQEAFLAAWQRLPSFRGEERFLNWLFRIASLCCVRLLEGASEREMFR
jgi:RNA polymerase sigma-70 factor (ECF subfamily)